MTDLELLQSMSPGSGRIIQSNGTVINIADAFYIEDGLVKLRTSGGGGGSWNGGTVTNPATFQSTVNFEGTVTHEGNTIFQDEIVWSMSAGGVESNVGSISAEKVEYNLYEQDEFASLIGSSQYEDGAGSASEEHEGPAQRYSFDRSSAGTDEKVVGVVPDGVVKTYYNENQSGNVLNDNIITETYKGNALITEVPTERVFGTYEVEMSRVEEVPEVTYRWKDPDGFSMLEFSSNSGRIAGFGVPRFAFALYDFSINGGAQGDISLVAPTLPNNAVVYDVNWDVITTLTSAGDTATVTVGFPTDGNLFAATAINNPANPWDEGAKRAPGAMTPRKMTANRIPQITVGVQDVTAGKIMFCFSYWISE
jgi:hypothetical protein